MPKRIQLKRTKGWTMPPNTVKVDRSTKWGNPWTVPGDFSTNRGAVARFRSAVMDGPPPHPESYIGRIIADARTELRGKDLACWCKPEEPCHADVLLQLANG
jgi:hypothetical protein